MLSEPSRPAGQPAQPPKADPPPAPSRLPIRRPGSTDLSVFTTRQPGREYPHVPSQPWRWLPALCTVLLLMAGCSSGPASVVGQPASRTAGAGGLAGVCPATMVVQSNWWPQAEEGAFYRLLGGTLSVDRAHKRVSGRLVADGTDTGVRLEIRSGGPANNFTPAVKLLYLDRSVMLGVADTDQVAQVAGGGQPVKAVAAPMDLSPVVLMFDPARHRFNTIGEIGQTDTRVVYFQGATYMQYLTGSGILRQSQVDPGYQGTPDRWVASGGSIVQQGFLTNEVYAYQHDLRQWGKPVGWLLVSDSGYPIYPESLTIRSDRETELAPCLRRLVPLVQRSIAGYLADPGLLPGADITDDLDRHLAALHWRRPWP